MSAAWPLDAAGETVPDPHLLVEVDLIEVRGVVVDDCEAGSCTGSANAAIDADAAADVTEKPLPFV